MKTTKKFIGAILALAMLLNVFSLISFAMTPDTAYELSISTDKDSYLPGEEVTFTLSVETDPSIAEIRIDGTYAIGYNSNVIDVPGDKYEITSYKVTPIVDGYDESCSLGGVIETAAIDTTYDWNAGVTVGIGGDFTTIPSQGKVDLLTFKMKLSDTVADGDYVVGFNRNSYEDTAGYFNDAVTTIPETAGVSTANVFAFNDVTIHVASAPVVEGPVVAKNAAQVKFTLNQAGNGVEDAFLFRVKSVITKQDWDDYFKNTGVEGAEDKNKITAVGMVAFPNKAEVTYNEETAKTIALNAINSPDHKAQDQDGIYKAASTTYIQKVNADSDAYFGVIVDTSHTNCQTDIYYLGFVQYYDANGVLQMIFYKEPINATVASNYDTNVQTYLNKVNGK